MSRIYKMATIAEPLAGLTINTKYIYVTAYIFKYKHHNQELQFESPRDRSQARLGKYIMDDEV